MSRGDLVNAEVSVAAAFASDGHLWAWGCVFAASPRQTLARLPLSRKYRKAKLGAIADAEKFRFEFTPPAGRQVLAHRRDLFPPAAPGRQVPLVFERASGGSRTSSAAA
jgi:hypothetical protein